MGHTLVRQNVGTEQGKKAGKRDHVSMPGIWKEEKQRTISHGVRMNARSHQYLSLQLRHAALEGGMKPLSKEERLAIPQG